MSSAIKAGVGNDSDPIAGVIVVNVMYHARVYVIVRAVVEEVAGMPIAALVAEANVAKAVVDAAVEADVQAPVAGIKAIATAVEPPIARRPERAGIGWFDPRAGHPVIASRAPCPIAGSPDIAVSGRRWLLIVGQRRRSLG